MAKKLYLVVHPKLGLNVALDGEKKSKLQNVPKGTEINMDEAHAKNLVDQGKLKLISAKKAAKSGGGSELTDSQKKKAAEKLAAEKLAAEEKEGDQS